VECRGSDPQVVGVDRFVQRMADLTAGVTKLRCGRQQGITDWHDCRRRDRLLEPLAALVSPAGNEGAVADLGDGDGGEEDLVRP